MKGDRFAQQAEVHVFDLYPFSTRMRMAFHKGNASAALIKQCIRQVFVA